MGKRPIFPVFFICCLMAWMMSGCTGRSLFIAPDTAPAWHHLQSGLYNTPEGRVFYGIGKADGVRNLTLLRATADNRARKALAGVLETFVGELERSQALAAEPGWSALSVDERRQVLGTVLQNSLQRAVVSDHWSDSQQPNVVALCRLAMPEFRQALASAGLPDEKVRTAMVRQAEKMHTKLARTY